MIVRSTGKVNVAPGDYRDPGWYKHPKGTMARDADADPNAAPTAPPMDSTMGHNYHH